ARATRVHAPAAVEGNRSASDPPVLRTGLITILKRGIRARVITVRLTQTRLRYNRADADRIGLAQGMKECLCLAHVGQRLRVAQMGVRVHQTDLAAEERRGLRPLEDAL